VNGEPPLTGGFVWIVWIDARWMENADANGAIGRVNIGVPHGTKESESGRHAWKVVRKVESGREDATLVGTAEWSKDGHLPRQEVVIGRSSTEVG
jgi:hypothetical protein